MARYQSTIRTRFRWGMIAFQRLWNPAQLARRVSVECMAWDCCTLGHSYAQLSRVGTCKEELCYFAEHRCVPTYGLPVWSRVLIDWKLHQQACLRPVNFRAAEQLGNSFQDKFTLSSGVVNTTYHYLHYLLELSMRFLYFLLLYEWNRQSSS